MINILFCGNDKIFDGILSCTLSILKRTESTEPFTFYLFTMDVSHLNPSFLPMSQQQAEFLENAVKKYNSQNRVILKNVTDIYMQEFSGCPNEGAYCSPYTLIRLFADLVEELPDKLLYLDADILFSKDIRLLYDINIDEYEYAAARDHYGKFLVYPNYINAGVLLLNMVEIKKSGLMVKARELLRKKKLPFADQSALIRSTTKRLIISQRFNDQKRLYKGTVVRHFSKRLFWLPYPHTDNIKQWHIDKVHKVFKYHQFDDIFEEFLLLKESYAKETIKNEQ